MNVDPICPVCNVRSETILHSLVTCPIIEIVWNASSLSLRISLNNANVFKEWIHKWFREEEFKTKEKKWILSNNSHILLENLENFGKIEIKWFLKENI